MSSPCVKDLSTEKPCWIARVIDIKWICLIHELDIKQDQMSWPIEGSNIQVREEGGCCASVLLVVKILLGANAETTRTSEIQGRNFTKNTSSSFRVHFSGWLALASIKMFHRFILYYGLYNLKPLIPCIAEELSMIGLCETPWNCVFSKKFPLRSWFLNSSKSKLTEASNQSPKGTLYVEPAMC